MDPYTTRGQARIQQRNLDILLPTHRFLAPPTLAALEWQRGCQAEVELDWLLRQHGLTSPAGTSRVARLRQTIGAVLTRAGERLAGAPRSMVLPETVPAAGPLGPVG